jgi:hypothetical protein
MAGARMCRRRFEFCIIRPECRPEARERIGLTIDVAELDRASARRALQAALLARDAGVAHRT